VPKSTNYDVNLMSGTDNINVTWNKVKTKLKLHTVLIYNNIIVFMCLHLAIFDGISSLMTKTKRTAK
jgi:hypothetical protein